MPDSQSLDKVFADSLTNQPEGHAFYFEVSGKEVKPGTCGFFDKKGDWNTIAQITDQSSLDKLKNPCFVALPTGAGEVEITSNSNATWGVRNSASTSRFFPQLDLGVNVPTAPVGAGITVGYKTESESGAILMTNGKITESKAKPEDKILEWMTKERAEAIMKLRPVTREKGIWIATKTYTANTRALAVLQSKNSEATFGVNVELFNSGTVAPSASWWNGHKDSMWVVHENPDGVVLFMSGIYWAPKTFSKTLKPEDEKKKQRWLAPSDKPMDLDLEISDGSGSETVHIKLVPEHVGKKDGSSDGILEAVKAAESDDEFESGAQRYADDDDLHEDFR